MSKKTRFPQFSYVAIGIFLLIVALARFVTIPASINVATTGEVGGVSCTGKTAAVCASIPGCKWNPAIYTTSTIKCTTSECNSGAHGCAGKNVTTKKSVKKCEQSGLTMSKCEALGLSYTVIENVTSYVCNDSYSEDTLVSAANCSGVPTTTTTTITTTSPGPNVGAGRPVGRPLPGTQTDFCSKFTGYVGIYEGGETTCNTNDISVGSVYTGQSSKLTLMSFPHKIYHQCCVSPANVQDKGDLDCGSVTYQGITKVLSCQLGKSTSCARDYFKQNPPLSPVYGAVKDINTISVDVDKNVGLMKSGCATTSAPTVNSGTSSTLASGTCCP